MDPPDIDPLAPAPCIDLFHLARGHSWGPAQLWPRRAPPFPLSGHRGAPSAGLQEGRRIPGLRRRKERGERPGTETTFGVVSQGLGLLWRPFAHPQGDDQRALRSDRRMGPPVASLIPLVRAAALRLFFTPLHCSSPSSAFGVRPCTCGWWTRGACQPVTRHRRATVSLATCPSRAVALTLQPAPSWGITSSPVGAGSLGLHQAVPRCSEHSAPQVRQRSRRRQSCPYTLRITRLLAPARRNHWHAALTQARVSTSGRCMLSSLRTGGHCVEDFRRPSVSCQPLR
jgi:hypothetical protein